MIILIYHAIKKRSHRDWRNAAAYEAEINLVPILRHFAFAATTEEHLAASTLPEGMLPLSENFSSFRRNVRMCRDLRNKNINHHDIHCVPKSNHPTTNDNFNSCCPISIFLVQILLSKYAIKRWFNFPPHLFSVRTLPWKTWYNLLGSSRTKSREP